METESELYPPRVIRFLYWKQEMGKSSGLIRGFRRQINYVSTSDQTRKVGYGESGPSESNNGRRGCVRCASEWGCLRMGHINQVGVIQQDGTNEMALSRDKSNIEEKCSNR